MQALSQRKFALFRALTRKKEREAQSMFLTEGIKMWREAQASGWKIEASLVNEYALARFPELSSEKNLGDFFLCTDEQLTALSDQSQPEGIISVVHIPPAYTEATFPTEGSAILLDQIQDPGNLGTILRIADWLGIQQVACAIGTCEVWNPKVLRASMGAAFRVKCSYHSDFYAQVSAQAQRIYAADMQGIALDEVKWQGNEWILMGNEANGLSAELRNLSDLKKITIPGKGGAESLNVAMATAIISYVYARNF